MAFYQENKSLFREGDLERDLQTLLQKVPGHVDEIPKGQFLATPDDELVEYVFASMEIEPIELHEEAKTMEEPKETSIDVTNDPFRNMWREEGDHRSIVTPGMQTTISVPYTGANWLWDCRPSSYQLSYPRGNVRQSRDGGLGYLDVVIALPHDESKGKYQQLLDETLNSVRIFIDNQRINLDDSLVSG